MDFMHYPRMLKKMPCPNKLHRMKERNRDSVKHDARKIFTMCNNNPSKECRQKVGKSDKRL